MPVVFQQLLTNTCHKGVHYASRSHSLVGIHGMAPLACRPLAPATIDPEPSAKAVWNPEKAPSVPMCCLRRCGCCSLVATTQSGQNERMFKAAPQPTMDDRLTEPPTPTQHNTTQHNTTLPQHFTAQQVHPFYSNPSKLETFSLRQVHAPAAPSPGGLAITVLPELAPRGRR